MNSDIELKESLEKRIDIIEGEQGYEWSSKLANGVWICSESLLCAETQSEAKKDALDALTPLYEALAMTPIGVPIEHRDFQVSYEAPGYAFWQSCGNTFGDRYNREIFLLDSDVYESAKGYLSVEYSKLNPSVQPRDPFEQDEIVLMIRRQK